MSKLEKYIGFCLFKKKDEDEIRNILTGIGWDITNINKTLDKIKTKPVKTKKARTKKVKKKK